VARFSLANYFGKLNNETANKRDTSHYRAPMLQRRRFMKLSSPRLFSVLSFSLLLISQAPSALPADDRDEREVRVVSVQGDVRLSRGDGKRPDLKKPWEQAQDGELVEQGFALATGNGRAEIEFENGSTVYLAENSLLLFRELSAPRDRVVSRITLATGTATFALQLASNEALFIETPTTTLEVPSPDTFFGRVDAYLDATALTPQGARGEGLVRRGLPNHQIAKGQTLFLQGGEIIELAGQRQSGLPSGLDGVISAHLREIESKSAALRASGFSPLIPGGLMLESLPTFLIPQNGNAFSQGSGRLQHAVTDSPGLAPDWDSWVSGRLQRKSTVMAAALKASRLPSPIPRLAAPRHRIAEALATRALIPPDRIPPAGGTVPVLILRDRIRPGRTLQVPVPILRDLTRAGDTLPALVRLAAPTRTLRVVGAATVRLVRRVQLVLRVRPVPAAGATANRSTHFPLHFGEGT
jgi:hypothetical protein